jgi:hypothetical protein
MLPFDEEKFWSQVDRMAKIVWQGTTYQLTDAEILHCGTDPGSSGFCTSLVSTVKRKWHPKIDRNEAIRYCADLLRVTVQSLEDSLDWNANYMAMHDGGTVEEMHAWPKEVAGNWRHD